MEKISKIMMILVALLILAAAPVKASPGLVGLWHLDDNALDDSGNENHGMVYGAAYVPGMFDKAIDLSGTGGYAEVGDDSTLRTDCHQDGQAERRSKALVQ